MEYREGLKLALSEIDTALTAVDENEVYAFAETLLKVNRVFAVGVGRAQLSLLAFVKRLNHMGVKATYVGAIDEPAIGPEDMLLAGSGSGETAFPVAIAGIAGKYGAKIAYIGSNAHSTLSSMADLRVFIPCQTKLRLSEEVRSIQPMGSLFEQCLYVFLDVVALLLIEKQKIDMVSLWNAHANLE